MDDCISRQQAIDALCNVDEYNSRSVKAIKNLPSAQQEIIRCKDCKCYKYGICMKIGVNKSFYGFCDWAERGEQP